MGWLGGDLVSAGARGGHRLGFGHGRHIVHTASLSHRFWGRIAVPSYLKNGDLLQYTLSHPRKQLKTYELVRLLHRSGRQRGTVPAGSGHHSYERQTDTFTPDIKFRYIGAPHGPRLDYYNIFTLETILPYSALKRTSTSYNTAGELSVARWTGPGLG